MRGVLIIAGYLLLSAGTAGAADLVGTARVIDTRAARRGEESAPLRLEPRFFAGMAQLRMWNRPSTRDRGGPVDERRSEVTRTNVRGFLDRRAWVR